MKSSLRRVMRSPIFIAMVVFVVAGIWQTKNVASQILPQQATALWSQIISGVVPPAQNPTRTTDTARTAISQDGDAEETSRTMSEEAARSLDAWQEMKAARGKDPKANQAQEFFRLKRLPAGAKEIPVEKYVQAQAAIRSMSRAESGNKQFAREGEQGEALGAWTSLGPGNLGGRTRALLIHPTTPNIMYAAGVGGGVWKTTNGGSSWIPLTDLMANLAVSSLTFDPNNANIIYAGTGEGYFAYNSIRGAGIFKSLDGGITWQQIPSTNNNDNFYYVNKIIISQHDPRRIYAATNNGVWRSLNGGGTWVQSLNGDDFPGGCLDMVVRTDQATDYIFASCSTFYQGRVFRNTDAANTNNWQLVLTDPNIGRTSLALAPSNQNVIYAAATSIEDTSYIYGLYAIYRSSNSGESGSWEKQVGNTDAKKLNTLIFSNPLLASLRECGYVGQDLIDSQGWYNNTIAVDPKDENRVWVGATDLFRSDDGGRNWGIASYWWAGRGAAPYAHANHHVIAFHPNYDGVTNKQMYVTNDGGVYRTDDARAVIATADDDTCNPDATQMVWRSLNNNYNVTQFYHGAVYPDGKSYFGGTQNSGTIRGTDATGSASWQTLLDGEGGYVAVDPTNPNILFASYPGGRFRKSTDGGKTFSRSMFGLKDNQFFYITPLALDASDPQHLWTGGSYLWRTDKGAANWKRVSKQSGIRVTAIAVAPSDSNYVLAGGLGPGILYTENGLMADGDTVWQTAYPREGFVSSLAFDPNNPQIAYATYSTFGGAHVWKSVNGGASWTSIDGAGVSAVPDIPVNTIVVDPANSQRLFIGTDMGVFVTNDGGVSWSIENTDFANVPVETLVLNTFNGVNTLYAFTHGRGAWRVPLGTGCGAQLSKNSQTFTQAGGTGSLSVTSNCAWTATVNASGADWLTVTSVTATTINYTVAPNTQFKPRIGTITIAGKSFSVLQPNASGSFSTADTTPPVVTITTPNPSQSLQASAKFITLYGTATDDREVVELSYVNDREGKTVTVTTLANDGTWQTTIPILGGSNHLTITARDAAGNIGTTQITAIYNVARSIVTWAGSNTGGASGSFSGDGGLATGAQLNAPQNVVVDSAGNLFFSDSGNHRVRKITAAGTITTIAGTGAAGFSGDNGQAVNAALNTPTGLVFDKNGNLLIADEGNHRVRKVTPQGVISTVAGNGNFSNNVVGDAGLAAQAELNQPRALAIDAEGNLYIGDAALGRIRRVSISSGVIVTIAGAGASGSTAEGADALVANLGTINDLVIDGAGNIFFTQGTAANSRIKKIGTDGRVTTFSNITSAAGMTLDSNGNLLVTSHTGGLLYKVAPDGSAVIIAGSGIVPGSGNLDWGDGGNPADAIIVQPTDVAIDAAGNIYVTEGAHRIRKIFDSSAADTEPPQIQITSPTANLSYATSSATIRLHGKSADNVAVTHVTWRNNRGGSGLASGTSAWLSATVLEQDIALQPGINLITVTAWDLSGNANAQTIGITYNPPRVVNAVAGNLTNGYSGENVAGVIAQLWSPQSVATDNAGNMYIADRGNHVIRRVTLDGVITTFAGTGQLGSSGDGGAARDASFNEPTGLAFDSLGNLYVADSQNNRIRKISSSGIISTVVGTGAQDLSGDGGKAALARLNFPTAVTADNAGNLYIADTGNNRIRKVTADGLINSIAGVTLDGFTGDGGLATQAQLNGPSGVAVDQAGNVFIADTYNNRIRKIATNGIITTVFGTGTAGFSGDNGAGTNAQLAEPSGLAVDAAGNVYVSDQFNHRIRKLGTDGKVSTVVGTGVSGTTVGGTDARLIQLNEPGGVAVDAQGNIFIADTENHRVVRVKGYLSVVSVNGANYYPNKAVAPESVVSAFGPQLATTFILNDRLPLPTQLGDVRVKVRDSAGIERLAPLYFVSQYQINYQVPKGTALGIAAVSIMNGEALVATEALTIAATQPGFFSANSDGAGAAASSLLFIKNGERWFDVNYTCPSICVPKPIDVSAVDEVYIEIFGTGIRYNSGMSNVKATVGGIDVPVLYAGAHCCYVGVDQINLQIPKALAGRGEVDIILTVDGIASNPIKIHVK